MKVLITGAELKQALGTARSLGKKGIHVVVGSPYEYAQAFYSRYCRERIIYPDPLNADEFVQFMLRYVVDSRIDVLLPIGHLVTITLSKYKDEFNRYVRLPVANYESMDIACHKDKTIDFARCLGIKTPRGYATLDDIESYPIVVKGIKGSGHVRYINSSADKAETITSGCMIQEYIPGEAYGFCALFNEGDVRASFMHRRIREYPATGGPSTAAESIFDPQLRDLGLRLLAALNWHGVAMVEFKKDSRNGEFNLMEINPRFWGSLDLSIASGVDFPYLATKMAAERDVESVTSYQLGVKFRWLFPGEVLHLLANPSSIKAFVRDCFGRNVKTDLWMSDAKPNLFQILATLWTIATGLKNRNLRHPHGIPEERS